ncbi:hypothetical protein V865_008481 [Kwoniella europaea PYCC6329]|uniref:Protein CPL1-like domain-containing protein n=1 Tax=Kwoniella europaea PYCC6329 TaxID=1423913 RepID=A0AAX4KV72_9TREE
MMLSSTITFLVLFALEVIRADEVFIGCYSYPEVLNGTSMEPMSSSDVNCFLHCIASDWLYAYSHFEPSAERGTDKYCLCSNDAPSVVNMVGDSVLCTAEENSVVSVSANVPRWRWTGGENGVCWGISSGSTTLFHSVTTALECISICTRYALVVYDDNSNPSGCWCEGFRWWEETFPTTCGFNVAFPYEFKFWETQPSNVVRRKARERRKVEVKEVKWTLCPDGKKACNIMDGKGLSYECIDPDTELESCGGCLHGEFSTHRNEIEGLASGVDCTILPGTSPSGVTCMSGRCTAMICESNYRLSNGHCVPVITE